VSALGSIVNPVFVGFNDDELKSKLGMGLNELETLRSEREMRILKIVMMMIEE